MTGLKERKRATEVEPATFSLEELVRPQASHGEPREISESVSATTVGHGQPRWETAQLMAHRIPGVLSCPVSLSDAPESLCME